VTELNVLQSIPMATNVPTGQGQLFIQEKLNSTTNQLHSKIYST